MDGFHIERKYLDEEGIKRRGAPFTFDLKKFSEKLKEIKNDSWGKQILYPDFDHSAKDPAEDAIKIPSDA